MTGTTEPWMIADHFGNIVARSETTATSARLATAAWTPVLDYHYVEATGRADFATEYSLLLSPTSPDIDVDVRVEGVQ